MNVFTNYPDVLLHVGFVQTLVCCDVTLKYVRVIQCQFLQGVRPPPPIFLKFGGYVYRPETCKNPQFKNRIFNSSGFIGLFAFGNLVKNGCGGSVKY